jgi:hypothetical protein
MQLTCQPVIANPQGEAIHAGTLDCFTLRVRNDVRDNLNCTPVNGEFCRTSFPCLFRYFKDRIVRFVANARKSFSLTRG